MVGRSIDDSPYRTENHTLLWLANVKAFGKLTDALVPKTSNGKSHSSLTELRFVQVHPHDILMEKA